MKAKDVLMTQYGFFYRTAKGNLDGISAEASVVQPAPGGNCTNWILGHLVRAHNMVMGLVEEAPVWDDASLDRADSAPITTAAEAIDWDTMVERLLASEERFMAALGALKDDRLDDDGFTDPFGNAVTRGAFLSLMAFHQTYHAGQLGLSRRLAGYDGVIGAPTPQTATA